MIPQTVRRDAANPHGLAGSVLFGHASVGGVLLKRNRKSLAWPSVLASAQRLLTRRRGSIIRPYVLMTLSSAMAGRQSPQSMSSSVRNDKEDKLALQNYLNLGGPLRALAAPSVGAGHALAG